MIEDPYQVAISGCGWVTPLAAGDIRAVLLAYANRPQAAQLQSGYEPAEEVLALFANLPGEAAKEGAVRLAAVALELAWKNAGLEPQDYPSEQRGLIVGCALAGVTGMIDFANDVREQSARFVSPIRFPQTVGNYICGALARAYDFRGPASTIACGCASGLEAVREGAALIAVGGAQMVLAGGCEKLSEGLVAGLNQPQVRFADGACFFVLERAEAVRKRKASILARVADTGTAKAASPNGVVTSTAGLALAEAIHIEDWIGNCMGAAGAAAIAAGIGANLGLDSPGGTNGGAVHRARDLTVLAAGLAEDRRGIHLELIH